jgi:hypothetical protein
MGWYAYFKLLEKYNGDLSKATDDEKKDAYLSNPNTPSKALEIAREKYYQKQIRKELAICHNCEFGLGVDEAGQLMCTNFGQGKCLLGEEENARLKS